MDAAFDYVDRLFNGLVYFVLNLVESIVSLFKNPVRGALRLTARSLNVNLRQASYRTLLFFIYATWYVLASGLSKMFEERGLSFVEDVIFISERPNLISAIIVATVGTTISELYIKHGRVARRSIGRRRNVFQIRFGYAFCFIAILLFGLEIALSSLSLFLVPLTTRRAAAWISSTLIPIMFFAGAAATTRPIIRMPALIGAFLVLVVGQAISGSVVEFYLTISSKRPFEILALSCRDEGQGRVDATAALINRTEDAMIVRFPDNIMLWGATATADREPQQYKIASPEAKHYLVIEPKKTMSLELKAESKTSEPRYPLCHLLVDASPSAAQNLVGGRYSTRKFHADAGSELEVRSGQDQVDRSH